MGRGDAICKASEAGDIEAVRDLLSEDPTLIHARGGESDDTPLIAAAFGGQPEVAGLLVAQGARLGETNRHGETALQQASRFCMPELDAGDPSTAGSDWRRFADVATLLIAAGADATNPAVLGGFARDETIEVLRALLANGAYVDAANDDGVTALHSAALYGSVSAAELLIASGASVNAVSRTLGTPLHVAAREGYPDFVALLLAHGASSTDRNGPYGSSVTPAECAKNEIGALSTDEERAMLQQVTALLSGPDPKSAPDDSRRRAEARDSRAEGESAGLSKGRGKWQFWKR